MTDYTFDCTIYITACSTTQTHMPTTPLRIDLFLSAVSFLHEKVSLVGPVVCFGEDDLVVHQLGLQEGYATLGPTK